MAEHISKKKSHKGKKGIFGKSKGGKKPFSLFGKKPMVPPTGDAEDPEEEQEME